MIISYRVVVDSEGEASQPGVRFGGRKQQPKLMKREGVFALFYLPGGPFWDGCSVTHNPSSYDLVELEDIVESEGGGFSCRIKRAIVRAEPGRRWKACRTELEKQLEELARGDEGVTDDGKKEDTTHEGSGGSAVESTEM
jgi:hypothetical protein